MRSVPSSVPVSMDIVKWSEYCWTVELTYMQWIRYSDTLHITVFCLLGGCTLECYINCIIESVDATNRDESDSS